MLTWAGDAVVEVAPDADVGDGIVVGERLETAEDEMEMVELEAWEVCDEVCEVSVDEWALDELVVEALSVRLGP